MSLTTPPPPLGSSDGTSSPSFDVITASGEHDEGKLTEDQQSILEHIRQIMGRKLLVATIATNYQVVTMVT